MLPAEVAPEVPAVALFAVGLLAGLTALFLVFLRFVSITLIGSMLEWIGDALSHIPFFGKWAADKILDGVNTVDNALGVAIQANEKLAVSMIHDAIKLTIWVADATANLAAETVHGFRVLAADVIPRGLHDVTAAFTSTYEGIEGRIGNIERDALAELRKGIDSLTKRGEEITRSLDRKIKAASVAVAGSLAGEIAGVRRKAGQEIGELRDVFDKRLTKVEKKLGIAALSGVVLAVIAKEVPWIRCPNMGRLGKQACKTPVQEFESLLAKAAFDAAAIYGVLNLEDFAKEMQVVVTDISTAVRVSLGAAPISDLESLIP